MKLMYITNDTNVAKAVQNAGVDRIFIDLEIMGKDERQGHLDTVISRHQMSDVSTIREVIDTADLLVRLNPLYDGTEQEVEEAIGSGADILMLPMFKDSKEVATFVGLVSRRATVSLLLETSEALQNLDEILEIEGIDEIHIGLNDLHLSMERTFMFELLSDGTVEYASRKIKEKKIRFGFGGIARIGQGILPAEKILAEHCRLGSEMAILSRAFHAKSKDINDLKVNMVIKDEIEKIRTMEDQLKLWTEEQLKQNREDVQLLVKKIIRKRIECS